MVSAGIVTGGDGGEGFWQTAGLLLGRGIRTALTTAYRVVETVVRFVLGWTFRIFGYAFDRVFLPFAGTAAGRVFGAVKDLFVTMLNSILPAIPRFAVGIFQSAIGDILAIVLAIVLIAGLITFGASKKKEREHRERTWSEKNRTGADEASGRDFSWSQLKRQSRPEPMKPSMWNRIQRMLGMRPSIDPRYVYPAPVEAEGRCDNATAWGVTPGKCSRVELPEPVSWHLSQGLEGLGSRRKEFVRDLLVPYKISQGKAVLSYRDAFHAAGYEAGEVRRDGVVDMFRNESLDARHVYARDFRRQASGRQSSRRTAKK